jgi:hypothetical protein
MEICQWSHERLDGANSPNMQDKIRHSELPGLAIGNHMQICSQAAREVKFVEL